VTDPDPRGASPGDYTELSLGELAARYVAALLDGGDDTLPAEAIARRALAQLALGTVIAERVTSGWALDALRAVAAGGSWAQVARSRGQRDPAVTRAEYAAWVRGQARLHERTGLGLDAREAWSARRLLDPPTPSGRDAAELGGPGR